MARDENSILTEKEREYIVKYDGYPNTIKTQQMLGIVLSSNVLWFSRFKKNKYYKNMKVSKKYTLEELGL